jgi:hypothetical protein
VLAVVLAAGAVFAFVHTSDERGRAIADAARRTRVIAETRLAPLLDESDLTSPITGSRYDAVAAAVKRTILDRTAVKQVTIWSDVGRILFAQDEGAVGTRPTFIRDFVYGVANGTTQTQTESGTLKTFTPIWRQPGGAVAVAELDQPLGPIAGTAGRLSTIAALALGLASLACWALFAMALRSRARQPVGSSMLAEPGARRPASASGAQALGPVMAAAPPSVVKRVTGAGTPPTSSARDPGVREAEKARTEAEQRARAAEERLNRLQLQHKQAMERLEALEARLSVAAAAPKQSQEELRALRDQVRESAERLHTAEAENERLRARLGTPHLPGVVGAGGSQR